MVYALTAVPARGYRPSRAGTSGAGIGVPSKSAEALVRSAFFVPVDSMAGRAGAPPGAPTLAGNANLVRSATLLIGVNGGGSRLRQEDTTMGTIPSRLTFQDVDLSVIARDGQPWVTATDVARALGYRSADAVSRIYRRNHAEFNETMTETVKLTVSGNMQTTQRIFSPRGAHLVAMFARTARAQAFRRWVLDVLDGLALPASPATAEAERYALANALIGQLGLPGNPVLVPYLDLVNLARLLRAHERHARAGARLAERSAEQLAAFKAATGRSLMDCNGGAA